MPAHYKIDTLAKSLLGNNCKKVDLFSASLVKGRGTVEDGGGILSSESNISMNSTTNSSTLHTMEVDAIGNMTKLDGFDFNWNGRRLESISQDGVELISYEYNIDGQRTKKTAPDLETGEFVTTEYFYNGDILAGQKTGNDVLIFMYDNNGDVFGFTYNGTPYYYIKNAQNDVYMIVDETGVAQVLYMYDAWGRIGCYDATNFGLATINPLMYRSYYLDVETGYHFYYLNSRYYMADLGRFISADATTDSGSGMLEFNIFVYCANNPVNGFDPTGCGFLKNLGKLLWLNVKTTFKLLIAPVKSVEVKIGLGYGLGGGLNLKSNGVSVGGTLKNTTTTSWEYSKGITDDRSTTGYEAGISLGPIYEFSRSAGVSHSLHDNDCTCQYGELYGRQHCPANEPFSNLSDSIGVSGALYLGVGGEISVAIDIQYMLEYGKGVMNEYYEDKRNIKLFEK